MANEKKYQVKNRSAGMVVYSLPELGIRREFAPGEVKKIAYSELEKLSYQSGGRNLMMHFLQIADEEVTSSLNIHTENEYYMSEAQIVELIKTGSLDAFLDCLDYAPVGISVIKQNLDIAKLFITQERYIKDSGPNKADDLKWVSKVATYTPYYRTYKTLQYPYYAAESYQYGRATYK